MVPRPFTSTAHMTAVALFAIMAAIQVLIAIHILPQDIVWGGSHGVHTLQLSAASIAAAIILCGFAAIIHYRATANMPISLAARVASWAVTAYMALNTVGNCLSSNPVERYGFGIGTSILFLCCYTVSTTSQEAESYEPMDENILT